jgi:ribosomal subunit interface protein
MKLVVTGRQLTIAARMRLLIQGRLRRLDRLLGEAAVSAQCVMTEERGRVACDLTVHMRGDHMLHAIGRDAAQLRAVTVAADRVAKQALRIKGRWKTRRRTTGR